MPKSITLVAKGGDPAGVHGPLGFICELASDSRFLAEHPDALIIGDLLGDTRGVKARAFALSQRLLAYEPAHRGVQQLGVFEEVVIRQLQVGFQLLALHDRLIELGFSECHFEGPSQWSDLLTQAARLGGGRLRVRNSRQHTPPALRSLRAGLRKLANASSLRSATGRIARKVLSLGDPYGLMGAREKGNWSKGALWCYSTAHTYTLAGMAFEPFFPAPLTYLVENKATGGAPLRSHNRAFIALQEFGSRDFVPDTQEIATARAAIDHHLDAALVSPDERLVVALLRASPFYATFVQQHLPQGLYATELFQRWVEKTRPRALVTGNPVFEEYALHAARRNAIPTLVLQHGVLGDFCQFSDPRCDTYVVRGAFWRDFLSEASRKKAKILNPTTTRSGPAITPAKKTSILFLTAPYHAHDAWHPEDLRDILFRLMDVCARTQFTLTIRVHPLDDIKTYESIVASFKPSGTRRPQVRLTQSTPLAGDLETAAAAVLFSSTVFLDCLAAQVPVISFGWHEFSFKSEIERLGVFHFAPDLDGLAALARSAAEGKLAPFRGPIEMFLDHTPDDVLRAELRKAVDRIAAPASAMTPCG